MADKNKTLPTAFRITEETAEKFREIAQEMGANQQQTLAKLIEAYEMEKGKEAFPGMRENIETFEGFIRAATNMYLQVLESNQNMRALVRTEYDSQLKSKDRLIEELQAQRDECKKIADETDAKEKEFQKMLADMEQEKSRLEKQMEEERRKHNTLLEEMTVKCKSLSDEKAELQNSEKELKNMLSSFMKECNTLKEENSRLAKDCYDAKEKAAVIEKENINLTAELEQERRNMAEERIRFEYEKQNLETTCQLTLQKKENELQIIQKKELDELRKEADKYRDLYYEQMKPTDKESV